MSEGTEPAALVGELSGGEWRVGSEEPRYHFAALPSSACSIRFIFQRADDGVEVELVAEHATFELTAPP